MRKLINVAIVLGLGALALWAMYPGGPEAQKARAEAEHRRMEIRCMSRAKEIAGGDDSMYVTVYNFCVEGKVE